jgi:site-specific recombinase XerD
VLQDVGYVDALISSGRDRAMLELMYAAGGERMRRLALARVADAPAVPEREVA